MPGEDDSANIFIVSEGGAVVVVFSVFRGDGLVVVVSALFVPIVSLLAVQ